MLGDARPQQLLRVVARCVVELELRQCDGVERGPRLGLVSEDEEFDRQALAVLLEELVDAIGVGLDERTRLARHDREVERGRTCEPDGA